MYLFAVSLAKKQKTTFMETHLAKTVDGSPIIITLCRSLLVRENGRFDTYTVLLLGAKPPLILATNSTLEENKSTLNILKQT